MRYAHLHCHTDHSFLDGVGRSDEYAEIAASLGMTALACTDHGGSMHGLPAHRRACKKFGIKPIYGGEFYVNDEREKSQEAYAEARAQKKSTAGSVAGYKELLDPTFTDAHLILLAQDAAGWKNLLKINHESVKNGFYYRPRTTHDLVCEHSEGLIATTACVGSLFGRYARANDLARLRPLLRKFKDAFGDRFFYEVQYNEMPEQKKVNAILRAECTPLGIKPVLTSDVHYACVGDDARQDEMIAVSRWSRVDAPDAFKLTTRSLHLSRPRDAGLMATKYGYDEGRDFIAAASVNAAEVADRCGADIYGDGSLRPPHYIDEHGKRPADPFEYLKKLAVDGYRQRIMGKGLDSPEYRERLKRELSVIRSMRMTDFYLVTWDVVRECKAKGIFVWTRGSGCASLVAACVGITALDPIRFGLLFERFVDPSRPNAPDFDLDIDAARRYEIIEWLEKKYGGPDGERIARICSVQTFGIRAAVRDVLKCRGVAEHISAKLAAATESMKPAVGFPVPQAEIDLGDAKVADRSAVLDKTVEELREVAPPEIKDWINANEPTLRGALTMVGRARGQSLHAAGFVVSPEPIVNLVPVSSAAEPNSKRRIAVTSWSEGQASQDLSDTGLMKLDLLGLDTCSAVSSCVAEATRRHGRDVLAELDAWSMDFSDEKVVAEFMTGNGFGLHQLQEQGQQLAALVKKLRPKSVDDIVAAVALYRPGAMDHMDEFIARSSGSQAVPAFDPVYDEITAGTYGILVYQEQIMFLLNRVGGIPLRDAYGIIKAISKKQSEKIEKGRAAFIAGAEKTVGPDRAKDLFESVMAFAGYGFNKAHAASYGVLSWITAYLRAHYPLEFWWAWLCRTVNKSQGTQAKDPERKMEVMMKRARAAGITLYSPLLGRSSSQWRITENGGLLAPLSLISGIGDRAADLLFEAAQNVQWTDLWSFLYWVEKNSKVCNAKVVKCLATAGALRKLAPLDLAFDAANAFGVSKATKAESRSQMAQRLIEQHPAEFRLTRPDPESYAVLERQALGFTFWRDSWSINDRSRKAEQLESEGRIVRAGTTNLNGKRRAFAVTGIKRHIDRKGNEMGFLTLAPRSGPSVKGVVFASVWKHVTIRPDKVYLIRGNFNERGDYVAEGGDSFADLDAVSI